MDHIQGPAGLEVKALQSSSVPAAARPGREHTAEPSSLPASSPGWSVPLAVAAVSFLTYTASLRFGFVYDDRVQILNNPWLESWRFVPRYFTENAAAFTGHPGGAFWRPLFLLWFFVNRAIFGLQPWGWHLTTVALHSLAAVLVYVLAQRLLRDSFLAGFAAMLFGVYPGTVETAAWVAGCTDSLLLSVSCSRPSSSICGER